MRVRQYLPTLPKTIVDDLSQVEKYNAYTKRTEISEVKCKHYDVERVSATEIRCKCGAGWTGHDVEKLFIALKHRP